MVAGRLLDFDAIYKAFIEPAIAAAGLEAVRAQDHVNAVITTDPQLEQILLSDCAIFDITASSAALMHAFGARRALYSRSTVVLYARGVCRLPVPVELGPYLSYEISMDGGVPDAHRKSQELTQMLRVGAPHEFDALFRLLGCPRDEPIARLKTDVFRDQVGYPSEVKEALGEARSRGVEAVRRQRRMIGHLRGQPAAVAIDLLLSLRAVHAWDDMIALVDVMPEELASSTMVQEQLAFALNRAGRGEDAERILREVIERCGENSETSSLLGRVYKDRWDVAVKEHGPSAASCILEQAAEAYLRGFEADWRDAFPGINAITLMELMTPPDRRREKLIPLVSYAVERRIARGVQDYWDYATLVELGVLARDMDGARGALREALAMARESWEPESTARNLKLIREGRAVRGDAVDWAHEVEAALLEKARSLS